MIVAPLVLISILAAVTKLSDARALGAMSVLVPGLLMITTAASALIGVAMTTTFGLRADAIVQGVRELERGNGLQAQSPRLMPRFASCAVFLGHFGGAARI